MRISRRDCIFIRDTKAKYKELARRAWNNNLPWRIHDNITGMDVEFELDTSKEEEASSFDEVFKEVWPPETSGKTVIGQGDGLGWSQQFERDAELLMQAWGPRVTTSDGVDNGVPVAVKVEGHSGQCSCNKCVKARMSKTRVVTKWQFGTIVELLSDLVDYKRDKPRPQAIEVYAQEILLTLGLEYKGGRK